MRFTWFKLMLLVSVVAFAGCDNGERTPLEGNDWTLISFQDAAGSVTQVPQEMPSTLYFDKKRRSVTGTVRCNSLSATYRASWRRISLANIAVTEMGCGPDEEGQDRFVMKVLGNLDTYTITDNTLQLRSKNGDTLTYVPAEVVDTDDQVLKIELDTFFGECVGYCREILTVEPQMMSIERAGQQYNEMSVIDTPLEVWNDLVALVDIAAFDEPPEVIDCPDCIDGASNTLTLTTTEGVKSVTIEFNAQIKELEPLLTKLRAIKTEMFAQTDSDMEQTVADLNRNLALWRASGLESYRYTSKKISYYPQEEDIIVTVKNGQVVSAVYTPSGEAVDESRIQNLATIDDYFDLLQEAVDKPADKLKVEYDPRYGYPAYIYIDYELEVTDEEIGYNILTFEPL